MPHLHDSFPGGADREGPPASAPFRVVPIRFLRACILFLGLMAGIGLAALRAEAPAPLSPTPKASQSGLPKESEQTEQFVKEIIQRARRITLNSDAASFHLKL